MDTAIADASKEVAQGTSTDGKTLPGTVVGMATDESGGIRLAD